MDPESDPTGFFATVYEAVVSGNYMFAAVLAVMGALVAVRKLKPRLFDSDMAGTALALAVSFVGALSSSLAAGKGVSWEVVKAAATVGVLAIGSWSGLWKRLMVPLATWVKGKL